NCSSISVARSGSGRATRTVYISRLLWMNIGFAPWWDACRRGRAGSALGGHAFGGLAGEEGEDHGLLVLDQPFGHRHLFGQDLLADLGHVLMAGLARSDDQRAVGGDL